jgi:protein O-mannosyl-transferase
MNIKKESGKPRLPETASKDFRALLIISLILISFAAYYPVLNNTFHDNWDDNAYITTSQRVRNGLSADNVVWAFTNISVGFYYPLTWLSHMTDIQLYGLNPKGHYATNIILHCLNVLLFFLLLLISTGSQFRSFLAAVIFSLHPMNVESVAWLAERKNLLSVFFLLLALICYVLRFKSGGGKKAAVRYKSACYLFFIMGLMSKSSIVVFPFLLLIFDLWPLKRISDEILKKQPGLIKSLFMEKLPFFALSFVSGILTIAAQKGIEALIPLAHVSLPQRISEAFLGYGFYLEKFFLPVNLCAFYPHHQGNFPILLPFLIFAILSAATFYFYRNRKENPVLIAGWLFFMVSLLPVIGIIQVGSQSHADRYVYFPYWGLFIILLFGIPREKLLAGGTGKKTVLAVLSLAIVLSLFILTRAQTAKWKDDETLFTNIIKISPDTILGYFQLGNIYLAKEDPKKALDLFLKANEVENNNPDIVCSIGLTYMRLNDLVKSLEYLNLAIMLKPDFGSAYYNKACTLINMKKSDEALENLDLASKYGFDAFKVQETTKSAQAVVFDLLFKEGQEFAGQGKWGEAEKAFRKGLELSPGKADAWCYFGYILQSEKNLNEAEKAYQKALDLDSSIDVAIYNLALIEIQKNEPQKARIRLTVLEKMNSSYVPALKKALDKK